MIKADQYLKDTLREILEHDSLDDNPRAKIDGKPAYSKFITQTVEKYDISKDEFPIPTLRPTAIKTGIKEILWIYQKQSNSLEVANSMGITWWDEFDIGNGTIGNRYGYTVKKYKLIDNLLFDLEFGTFSRRHILDLYQYEDLNSSLGLHPCAFNTMWSVREVNDGRYIDVTLTLRSSDYLVAGFINRVQYLALAQMICGHLSYYTEIKHTVGNLMVVTQNAHLYLAHFDAAAEILEKEPLKEQPTLKLKEKKNFYDYTTDDFEIYLPGGITKLKSELKLAI